MDAIIITAAPGMGKTTVFPTIAGKLSEKSALLDGDDDIKQLKDVAFINMQNLNHEQTGEMIVDTIMNLTKR